MNTPNPAPPQAGYAPRTTDPVPHSTSSTTKRHWVYWRSPYHGDERIIATKVDDEGVGYFWRCISGPEHEDRYYSGRVKDNEWLWRISAKEVKRLCPSARMPH